MENMNILYRNKFCKNKLGLIFFCELKKRLNDMYICINFVCGNKWKYEVVWLLIFINKKLICILNFDLN